MQDMIEQALGPLVGRPLWDAGRAGAMLWLQLGDRRVRPADQRGAREVGEFALHVSCAWRLIGPEGIHAASGDMFTPADPDADPGSFSWDEPGANWCDVQLRAFIATAASAPVTVQSVSADDLGSLRLFLSGGYVLDVFPDSSHSPHVETEFWRLLQPTTSARHFVVGSAGIDQVTEA
jgi:hypothetical protein